MEAQIPAVRLKWKHPEKKINLKPKSTFDLFSIGRALHLSFCRALGVDQNWRWTHLMLNVVLSFLDIFSSLNIQLNSMNILRPMISYRIQRAIGGDVSVIRKLSLGEHRGGFLKLNSPIVCSAKKWNLKAYYLNTIPQYDGWSVLNKTLDNYHFNANKATRSSANQVDLAVRF